MLAIIQGVIVLLLYFLGALVVGLALTPSIMLFIKLLHVTAPLNDGIKAVILGLGMAGGFFIFGLTLLVLVGFLNIVLNLRLKEGDYSLKDGELFKWYFLNALVQAVKAFFMDFMLLTPFASLFYRMMGAKLGRNVQINSKNVADISLLEIGDNSVIGGNATVIGHIFERKGLKLKKIKIGANVVIGLNSVIMPGVEIGDGAIVAAGAVVPKGTIIEPKTVYSGKKNGC
jgi:hypothetical protein